MAVFCGVTALAGHVWPVYLDFKGGKGVATGAGVVFALDWMAGMIVAVLWGIVFCAFRTISLASIVAAASLPIVEFFTGPRLWVPDPHLPVTIFCFFAAVLVVARHRENLKRLKEGKEPQVRLGGHL